MQQPSVCAVVVTFNRKELLVRCIQKLLKQTIPFDKILIVNNASTDGTLSYLEQQGITKISNCEVVTLEQNLGGAGGFHFGIKRAFEAGFEQIFLMDDDGYPDENSLAELLPHLADNVCLGSLVLDEKDPQNLCFPIRLPNSKKIINTTADISRAKLNTEILGLIIPFNGLLLSHNVVECCGFPKSEYFIWGDDMEYIWRLQKHKIQLKTIQNAKFYHPREQLLGSPMLFGLFRFNDTPSLLKLYCMSRNNTVNLLVYKNQLSALFFIFKLCWFYSFTKPSYNKLKIGLRGIYHGFKRDFSHHMDYLT